MRRKNTRRFDPRYFMDEKTEKPKPKVIKEAAEETDWTRVKGLGGKPHAPGASAEDEAKYEYVNKCFRAHRGLDNEEFVTAFNECMTLGPERNWIHPGPEEEPMAEGQTLAEISVDTDWKQVNQQIWSAKNALQKVPPDVKTARDILTDLLDTYPKFDIK